MIAAATRAIGAPAPWGNAPPASIPDTRRPLLASFPGNAPLVLVGDSHIDLAPWGAILDRSVVNHGISGDTTDGVLERLGAVIATGAGTALLMVGINDLRRGDPVSEIAGRYRRILDRLPEMRIVSAAVLTGETIQKERARQLNQEIRSACTGKCRFLSLDDLVSDGLLRTAFSPDRIHLNSEGYRTMARHVIRALENGQSK
ncbi:MAG: hypothetical protein IT537_00995 [Hyphomicrobiales bacterium]|nr:hypothetical protein [Hyphomicrobiales bacterium]